MRRTSASVLLASVALSALAAGPALSGEIRGRLLADDRPVATAQGMRVRILFPLAFAMACGLAGLTGAVVTPSA